MKKIKNIFLTMLFFIAILFITNGVKATSITASPSNPKKGQSVKITVSVSNVNTVDLTATVSGAGTSGTIRLVDGSLTGDAKTFSKSITVKPTTTGTISVVVASTSNAVLNGQYVENVVTSKNITVTEASTTSGGSSGKTTTKPQETEKSKDSTLKGLSVEEGAITPEFKKDVKEYTLAVPYETTEVNVTATPTDSKAKVEVKGNKDLKEGENVVTVTVTAEDGSKTDYTIKVTRARVPLALKSLVIKYENQQGELVEALLNPAFAFDILEYSLEDLEYWVENLSIEAIANLEGAEINIQGAENLQIGENTITITLKIAGDEQNLKVGEDLKDEVITYTIKVNKKEEPTIFGKISNWFNGLMGTVSVWYVQNERMIVMSALGICTVALFMLSIYIVVDYRKYKDVIAKVKKTKEINNSADIIEEIGKNFNSIENDNIDENDNGKQKGGKHF